MPKEDTYDDTSVIEPNAYVMVNDNCRMWFDTNITEIEPFGNNTIYVAFGIINELMYLVSIFIKKVSTTANCVWQKG